MTNPVPTLTVAVLNHAAGIGADEVNAVLAAVNVQMVRDLAPAWGRSAIFQAWDAAKPIPSGMAVMALLDDSDQANALGYHEVAPSGGALGKVFVKADKDAGLDWHITFSHEACEMAVDPACNLLFSSPNGTRLYAGEVSDPVQSDAFGYDIGGIKVSDFVLPAWFDGNAKGVEVDHCGVLGHPMVLAPGGYISFLDLRNLRSGWQQVSARGDQRRMAVKGAHARPSRRKDANAVRP